jgi:hypothetical protein
MKVHIYDITKLINITPRGPGAAEGKWANVVIVLAVKRGPEILKVLI